MEPKDKKCVNKDCTNKFKQFNSLQKYCSAKCKSRYDKPKKLKVSAINKIGKKQLLLLTEYSKVRTKFLALPENQECPVTGFKTTEIHHKKGRVGFADKWARDNNVPLLIDTRYFLAVHRLGHVEIEENPSWAKDMGYSFSRVEDKK